MTIISINERATVLLTAEGARIINVYHQGKPAMYPMASAGDNYHCPLWELMQIFGPGMSATNREKYFNEIIVPDQPVLGPHKVAYNSPAFPASIDNSFSYQWACEVVLETFQRDEAQGYRSRDRQFAIAILGKAVEVQGGKS